jgi:hypothetical protein
VHDAEVTPDEWSAIPASRQPGCIWRSASERAAWRAAAEAAATAAALGYCGAVLGAHADVAVPASKASKKGGK